MIGKLFIGCFLSALLFIAPQPAESKKHTSTATITIVSPETVRCTIKKGVKECGVE